MKILITLLMALFISSTASAGDLDMKNIDTLDFTPSVDRSYGNISTRCIDGYKFLFLVKQISQRNGGVVGNVSKDYTYSTSLQNQIVQFYIEKDGRAVPAKC
jgi:hypothetical protein